MSAIEFIAMLEPRDIAWLLALQLISFVMLYRAISSRQASIIDPFTLPLIFAAAGWSTVIFLYAHGMCSTRLFVTFVLTGIAFLIGYRWVAPKLPLQPATSQASPARRPIDHSVFMKMGSTVTLLVLASIAINISMFGLGIQFENRLEIYTDTAGLGLIKRLYDALIPASLFFLIYVITRPGRIKRLLSFAIIITLTGYALFDGSKSGLVAIFLIFVAVLRWLHLNVDSRIKPISSRSAVLALLLSLVIAALVVTYQLDAFGDYAKFQSGIGLLFYRIVLAADIYVLGFTNDTIDRITQTLYPLLVLFNDLISTLRFASLEIIPIGTQLYNYFSPVEVRAGGPNAHISIYAYYLFGEYFSVAFCLVAGMLIGKIRRLYNRRSNRLVHGACATTLMINTAYVLVDPSYTMHRLTNLLIFLFPLYLFFRFKYSINRPLKNPPLAPACCSTI